MSSGFSVSAKRLKHDLHLVAHAFRGRARRSGISQGRAGVASVEGRPRRKKVRDLRRHTCVRNRQSAGKVAAFAHAHRGGGEYAVALFRITDPPAWRAIRPVSKVTSLPPRVVEKYLASGFILSCHWLPVQGLKAAAQPLISNFQYPTG